MKTMSTKLTVQKVAGALKRAGFEQARQNDSWDRGFLVSQVYSGDCVNLDYRFGRCTQTQMNQKMVDMHGALETAGLYPIMSKCNYGSGVDIEVYANVESVPVHKLKDTYRLTAKQAMAMASDGDREVRVAKAQQAVDAAKRVLDEAQAKYDEAMKALEAAKA